MAEEIQQAPVNKERGFGSYLKLIIIISVIIGGLISFVTDIKNQVFPVNIGLVISIINCFIVVLMLFICIFFLQKINVLKSEGRSFKRKKRKW